MRTCKRSGFLFLFLFLLLFFSKGQNARNGYPETQHLPPEADFGWSNFCFGDTTYFVNESIRGAFYKWAILNADTDTVYTSVNTNISFMFDTAGLYYVSLECNNGHLSRVTKTIYVDSFPVTSAKFSFMHCSNHFINMSGCAAAFKWDLGDGTTSTDAFPVHEYADTGHYTVKLTAYKGVDSSAYTKKIWVDSQHFPNPAFTYRVSYDTVFVHLVDDDVYAWHTAWVIDTILNVFNVTDTFAVFPDTGRFDIVFYSLSNCLYTGSDQWVHVVFPKHLDLSLSAVNIYPNPVFSEGYLDIYYNSDSIRDVQLAIYNALGQEVWQGKDRFVAGLNERKIGVADLGAGSYYLSLLINRQCIRAKFLVGSH